MLRRLPLDEVRIDRISIDTITTHPHDRAIVRSIIALTREIGLEVTADGVETGAQADALIALGCVRQQGHLTRRPCPRSVRELPAASPRRAVRPGCRHPADLEHARTDLTNQSNAHSVIGDLRT